MGSIITRVFTLPDEILSKTSDDIIVEEMYNIMVSMAKSSKYRLNNSIFEDQFNEFNLRISEIIKCYQYGYECGDKLQQGFENQFRYMLRADIRVIAAKSLSYGTFSCVKYNTKITCGVMEYICGLKILNEVRSPKLGYIESIDFNNISINQLIGFESLSKSEAIMKFIKYIQDSTD